MSTNSNEDALMDQPNPSKTKLQKFLISLDEQTMSQIDEYLDTHQLPQIQANTKAQKFLLHHDLLILQTFKAHEKTILVGNKKIIDDLCQELRESTGFLAVTIRERVQKKLANISISDIRMHIQLEQNFAFNTKRKLVPPKNIKSQLDEDNNLILDSHTHQMQIPSEIKSNPTANTYQRQGKTSMESKGHKESKQAISISSSEEGSVEEILYRGRSGKRKVMGDVQEEVQRNPNRRTKIYQNHNQNDNANEYENDFLGQSDHESDQEVLIIQNENILKISTKKGQEYLKQIMERTNSLSLSDKAPSDQSRQQQPKSEQSIQQKQGQKYKEKKRQILIEKRGNPKKKQIINIDASDQEPIQTNFPQKQPPQPIQSQQPIPPVPVLPLPPVPVLPLPSDLHQFCSLEDWQLAERNPQFSHLRWHQDEDQFLTGIVNNASPRKAASGLQVLKKFKSANNIVARIRALGLNPSAGIVAGLAVDL